MASSMKPNMRVAVVGSGITGLSAAWLLHRSGAKVTLFEKEEQCGGHTLTDNSTPFPVDLGFQVYNLSTYGNLVGFLDALGVDTEPSDMSFALSVGGGVIEWGSHSLDTIFAQRKNLLRPTFLRMIYDVIRFGRNAPEVMKPSTEHEWARMSLGQYLQLRGYSDTFRTCYVLPMCAAVWSVPEAQAMAFPVQMLIRFWMNHHLLDITQRPVWRVVKGRSQTYVQRVLSELKDVRTGTPVVALKRPAPGRSGPVTLKTGQGLYFDFDAVVLAVHSDTALAILGQEATPQEASVLGAIPYSVNDVYLHTDESLMPKTRKVWASWNFLDTTPLSSGAARVDAGPSQASAPVCVSYWLNCLQDLGPSAPPMFCTLNPPHAPAPEKTIRRLSLAHPMYSFDSVKAQEDVAGIQGAGGRGVYFAGAWCGYGFHEDGIKAGVAAATALGAEVPWTPRLTSPKVTLSDSFFLSLFSKFTSSAITIGSLRLILPTGAELHFGSPDTVPPPVPEGEEWRGRPRRAAVLRVLDMVMFRKVVLRTDSGLGEAYMDGDFEVDDIGGFLAVLVANAGQAEGSRGALGLLNWLGDRLLYFAHRGRANTIEGSRKNIEEHYDAGNSMYETFLDSTMTYSSALHAPGRSLAASQLAKLDAIIERAGISAGDSVLEIGCGWGSFAIRAAQTTGCRVTGLTLSKEQLAEATARVKAAGLEERVTLMFCDYRDCGGEGTFDKVVSIEMIEAVGHEHLRPYFQVISKMLKPGGTAVIQAITMPDERYANYCGTSDFIREHIFPGGHLPSMGAMVEAARGTPLSVQGTADIGPHYAITLREWRSAWEAKRKQVLALGYSDAFWRKYQFYFAYCEAAFDARYIRNLHVTWVKGSRGEASTASTSDAVTHLSRAVIEELPADPFTQVLLAIYFFLAGIVVSAHHHLWLLPLTSALAALAFTAALSSASALHPAFPTLPPKAQVHWAADLVHLVACLVACGAGAWQLLRVPGALSCSLAGAPTAFQSIMAAASTGFVAFQLWVWVRYRLCTLRTAPVGLMLHTVLLCLLAVAAVKRVPIPLLPLLLLGKAPSCLHLLARLRGSPSEVLAPPSRLLSALKSLDAPMLVALRLLPQVGVLAVAAAQPHAFPSLLYWAVMLAGLALLIASTTRRVLAATRPTLKAHTA